MFQHPIMRIPLEDNASDIISKAMRGLKLSDNELSVQTGIQALEIQRLREGHFNEVAARKVAPVLGLGADALAASGHKSWQPAPITLEGLAQFNTSYEDMKVNAYLVWDTAAREAAAFDTGADCSGILDALKAHDLTLKSILLTHTHGDHIFDLDRLVEQTGASVFVGEREPLDGAESFAEGREFTVGNLTIKTLLTSGHSVGGITYVITGLALPLAIVGDAVFAGSMGGGMVSYTDALKNNLAKILTLPDPTILCPGHGPLSTVEQEKINNPFFATHPWQEREMQANERN